MKANVSDQYTRGQPIGDAGIVRIIAGEIYNNIYADPSIGAGDIGRKPMEAVMERAVQLTLGGMQAMLRDPDLDPAVKAKLTSRLQHLGVALDQPATDQGVTTSTSQTPNANAPTISVSTPLPSPQQLPGTPRLRPILRPTSPRIISTPREQQIASDETTTTTLTSDDNRMASSRSGQRLQRAQPYVDPTTNSNAPISSSPRATEMPQLPDLPPAPLQRPQPFVGPTATPDANAPITSSRPRVLQREQRFRGLTPTPNVPLSPGGATTFRGPGDAQPPVAIPQISTGPGQRPEEVPTTIQATQAEFQRADNLFLARRQQGSSVTYQEVLAEVVANPQ
jgi:hypothetical protein